MNRHEYTNEYRAGTTINSTERPEDYTFSKEFEIEQTNDSATINKFEVVPETTLESHKIH